MVEVGRWERKASEAKIPVSFQFSILLGRFACVIPQHISCTSGAAEDCGGEDQGRRWKERCSERCEGDGGWVGWGTGEGTLKSGGENVFIHNLPDLPCNP